MTSNGHQATAAKAAVASIRDLATSEFEAQSLQDMFGA